MSYLILITPLLGAAIGWLINYLIAQLIFRPLTPSHILGMKIQGLIPAYKSTATKEIASVVATRFFSFDEIEQKITNPDNMKSVMPVIETHIDEFLNNKLSKEMPFLSMFIGSKTIDSLKSTFMKELETIFPQVMKNYAGNLRKEFDIERMIVSKLESISSETIEKAVKEKFGGKLAMFRLLGAVSGFVIGLLLVFLYFVVA